MGKQLIYQGLNKRLFVCQIVLDNALEHLEEVFWCKVIMPVGINAKTTEDLVVGVNKELR